MAVECPFPGLSSETSYPVPGSVRTPKCLHPFPTGNTDRGCLPTLRKTDISRGLHRTPVLTLHVRVPRGSQEEKRGPLFSQPEALSPSRKLAGQGEGAGVVVKAWARAPQCHRSV